jgi:hypothetical protein
VVRKKKKKKKEDLKKVGSINGPSRGVYGNNPSSNG